MTFGMIFYAIAAFLLFLGGIGSTVIPNPLLWGNFCIALGLLLDKLHFARLRRFDDPSFTPATDQQVLVDSSGRVQVRVTDVTAHNDRYVAAITDSTGANVSSGNLTLENPSGSPHFFSALLSAGAIPGSVPGSNNKTASVQGFQGSISMYSEAHNFKAYSSGSGSHALETTAAQVAKVFKAGQPVPHAMHLCLDAPGGESFPAGDPPPQPILLVHAPDPAQISWFSEPLHLGGEAATPGFWQLQKRDPRTWLLKLQRGNNLLVTYRHTTAAEKDGSLPIRLEIVDPGTGVIEGWPRTATVSAAP